MRKQRYTLFNPMLGNWLLRVEFPPEGAGAVALTTWTRHRERAMLFPGVKSARAVADKLGSGLEIHNAKGESV